ncbi:MAG TPA: SDR family oxidoreductase [Pilimelia sp.]|nr:SDR family oxidoreductase [Pilimelia sp.]
MGHRRVLVTGGQGYVGSVLTALLACAGSQVVVVDNGMVPGAQLDAPGVSYLTGDVRDVGPWEDALDRVDAVVHLAAVVGDPACGVDPQLALQTNYLGTINVAEACRRHGVRRMVFASTCSNYGLADDDRELDIWSPLNPQSGYAESKILAEHYLLSSQASDFTPYILRFATLHGLSPRMRFDLAVNVMTAQAVQEGRVVVHGGRQWRPFLHVRDAARAVQRTLAADLGPGARIYNCGSSPENYRLDTVAAIIAREVPGTAVSVRPDAADHRNYRVNFDRLARDLSFAPEHRLAGSVRELVAALRRGDFPDFRDTRHSNVLIAREFAARHRTLV